jgi:hypothetical protein
MGFVARRLGRKAFAPSHVYTTTVRTQARDWGADHHRTRPAENVTAELHIDLDALAEFMALRAAGSKSGVSKMQEGIILARVVKRTPVAS